MEPYVRTHPQYKELNVNEKLPSTVEHRYPEIDLLRSVAILGMVLYHTTYDLSAFYEWDIDPLSGGWWLFARTTAVLFLLVSGASNTIANARAQNAGGKTAVWKRTKERFLQIATAALLVTLSTYVFDPGTFIRFGILHCIAVSVFLLPIFQRCRTWNALLGIMIIVLGNIMTGITADTSLLLPLGILPPHFSSLDYFPLLPWFGVVLLGSAIADFLYVHKEFPGVPLPSSLTVLSFWISRFSLMIYLVHQPVILLLLMVTLGKPPA